MGRGINGRRHHIVCKPRSCLRAESGEFREQGARPALIDAAAHARGDRRHRHGIALVYTRAVALQAGAIRSALDLAVLEGKRNLSYSVQGSPAIQPSEITDNGQFTALRFPNQRELPAFFAVNPDGSERIVPFDVRYEFVVIHGVFAQLRLRRGREVLCVFNEARDFYGRDPKTGTASSIVERTPSQGNGEPK